MLDNQDIIVYVKRTYNHGISVYDHGSYVRVTNGSAAMYGDIHIESDTIAVGGERYGETFQERYERTEDGLERALSENLGL